MAALQDALNLLARSLLPQLLRLRAELAAARGVLSAQAAIHGGDFATDPRQPAVWADLAHALINAKEFIFVP